MTHKVLKSCRSTIATWAHDVYDVHEASSLYKKPVGEVLLYMYMYNILYIYIYIAVMRGVPQPAVQVQEMSFFAVVMATVPFLF